MRKSKKITLLIILMIGIMTIVGVNLPKKVQNVYNTNDYQSSEPQTLAEIEEITGEYSVMPLAVIGVEVSTFQDLKYFLELEDGNEYHIFVKNDISFTERVYQKGTKTIKVSGYDGVNAGYGDNMINFINDINVSTLSENNTTMIVALGNLTIQNIRFNGQHRETTTSANLMVSGTATIYWCEFTYGSESGLHVTADGTCNFMTGNVYNNNDNPNRTGHGIASHGLVNLHWGQFHSNRDGLHANGPKGNINIIGDGDVNIYSTARGIDIAGGSKANIPDRTKIHDNTYAAYNTSSTLNITGGEIYSNPEGVHPIGDGAICTMTGGKIYQNQQGIQAHSNARVVFSGGSVYNNTQHGLVTYSGSTIEMTGGYCYGNELMGVVNVEGTFIMTGGEIYGNNEYGIDTYINAVATNINGGKIYNNTKDGIHVAGPLSITNGEIYGNVSGVSTNANGTPNINISGGNIYDNTESGVDLLGSNTNLTVTGGTITGNAAGISVSDNSTANISNASIYRNDTGIYADNSGNCTISSGEISSNTYGIGISNGATVQMNGGSIYDNQWQGVLNSGGTFSITDGEIYSNSDGIEAYGNAVTNINGGTIYSNGSAVINDATLNITSGTFRDNVASIGAAVYHRGGSCTITGGNFEKEQNVYLGADGLYVETNAAYPIFTVQPNSYTRGRTIVSTSGNEYANNEIDNVTLINTTDYKWEKRVVDSDIVLWDKSKVTIKYQDTQGNDLVDPIVTENWIGELYTTQAQNIDRYRLVTTPQNATGTYADTDTEVIYVYEANTTQINVQYIDQSTGEIIDTETITGIVGDEYTTQAKTIIGYELVLTPSNATGTFTSSAITVKYEYRKLSTLSIKYVDLVSNTVIASDNISLKEGESYTTSAKQIDGYQNVTKPDSENITIERVNIEVIYGYRKTTAGVDIRYIDQVTGAQINDTVHIDGLEGITYSTTPVDISGYQLVVTPGNASGTYMVDKITVTYEYRKLSIVTVKHMDLVSNTVLSTDTKTLKEGDSYTSSAKTIDGYQNVTKPNSENITVGNSNVELIYGYKKISAGVDVKYIDQVTGDEIADIVHKDGLESDTYIATAKNIDGYQLVKSPDNETVIMTVDKITLVYEYRKLSTVTVKYIDENTGSILDSVVVTLKEGDTYTSKAKTISGYENTVKPENETVIVGRTNVELVYKYKKTTGGVDVKYIDQVTGEEIADSMHIDGLEGATYSTDEKIIEGYELVVTPSNASGTMTVETITVTYEYRKLSKVTIKHIDLNSNAVIMTVEEVLKEGDTYTATVKTITGYENVSKPDTEKISIGKTDVELIYGYRKTTEGVDVKYIDQVTGTEIVTEHIDGLEGIEYSTIPKEIDGYELVVTPSNTSGTHTVSKITVTYEYRKLSKVTVKHIDLSNNAVLQTDEATLKEGDSYTASVKTITGYENVSKPDSEKITIGREDIELVYGYKKVTGGVNIRYIDQVTGTEIVTEHIDGLEGSSYSTNAKDIEGYELVVTPSNASGTMTVETIIVTYEYRKLSVITVKYIDAKDNSVIQKEDYNLKEGDTFTSTLKTIEGYTNVSKPTNETITVGRTDIELVYTYRKTTAGVDVRYIDQSTQQALISTKHIDGLEGVKYTTAAEKIEGYELVVTPSNSTGTFTVDKIIVTYEYRKLSTLTIKHIDENSNEVLDTEIITLKEGETYIVNAKLIEGYVNTSTPDSETITMGRTNIEITYGYKKSTSGVDIRYIDQVTGDDISAPEHKDGVEGTAYTSNAITIDGYELVVTPNNANGKMTVETITVTYEYRKLSALTIKYIDENSNEVLDTEIITLKEGETYTVNAKLIEGYVNTSTPDNETITMGRTNIEITYGYKKSTSGVDIRYIDQVTGDDISAPEHKDGVEGTAYTSNAIIIDGYELVVIPNNANGEMTVETITVTYEYRKLSKIIVKHIDGNTKEVIETEEKILKEGEEYTSSVKSINGYKNTTLPETETIIVGNSDIEIIYEYKKVSGGVDIKYINKDTKEELVESDYIEGLEGDEYKTVPKEIPGYDLAVTPDNSQGNMTVDKITVTYEYSIVQGTIVVTKVDKKDNTILLADATMILEKLDSQGKVDETFTAIEKTTDKLGKIEFTGIEIGKYQITETIAPQGYQLATKPVIVEITEENRVIDIIQENSQKVELPMTGAINYTISISVLGFVIMMVSRFIKGRKLFNK